MLATARTRPWLWLLVAVLLEPQVVAAGADQPNGSWRVVSTLREARYEARAALLRDGRVLIVGGYSTPKRRYLRSAEVWDPRTLVSKASGPMAVPRAGHTATVLDDGRVLVVGGESEGPEELGTQDTAETWDPSSNRFSTTGSMHQARREHVAIKLADGRVAVDGGAVPGQGIEIWSAQTGSWMEVPDSERHRCNDPRIAPLSAGGLIEIVRVPPGTLWARKWLGGRGGLERVAELEAPSARRTILIGESRVFVVSPDRVDLWNPNTGELTKGTRERIGSEVAEPPPAKTDRPVVQLADGRVLAVSGRKALLWTPNNWKPPSVK